MSLATTRIHNSDRENIFSAFRIPGRFFYWTVLVLFAIILCDLSYLIIQYTSYTERGDVMTVAILPEEHELYRDLEVVITLLEDETEKNGFSPKLGKLFFDLLKELVKIRSIPSALEPLLKDFGNNSLEIFCSADQLGINESPESPTPENSIDNDKKISTDISSSNKRIEITTGNKPIYPANNPKKASKHCAPISAPGENNVVKLESKISVAEISSSLSFTLEGSNAGTFVQILAGIGNHLQKTVWRGAADEIARLREKHSKIEKIVLLEKDKPISLASEDDVFDLTLMSDQTASVFVWTTNDRICFWNNPETTKLEEIMRNEEVEPEELRYLIFVREESPENMEIALTKFSRKK